MRQHHFRPSQCFVLIKQSGSPCPYQFKIGCYLHAVCTPFRNASTPPPRRFHLGPWLLPRKVAALALDSPLALAMCPAMPNLLSQSLSRAYGSILPTSLTYIILSTRGFSPWRPAAVMSTAGCKNQFSPSDFHGPSGTHRTPKKNFGALPDFLPYLQVI